MNNERNLFYDEMKNNKKDSSGESKKRNHKFCEDPLNGNFDDKKDDCVDSPSQKIKDEFFDGKQHELRSQEEERFYEIVMKEEIKEEPLEDEIPLLDGERLNSQEEILSPKSSTEIALQNSHQEKQDCEEIPSRNIKEEFFESCDGTEQEFPGQEPTVGGCDKIMSQNWSVKEEEVGEILMKEEIKEEDLEDQSSLTDENKESLTLQAETLSNVTNQTGIQNCLQEKIECPLSNVMEDNLPLFHSKLVVFDRTLKLQKKHSSINKPLKCSSSSYQTAWRKNLKRHKRTHTDEKALKCSSCPVDAAQKSSFLIHERSHMGEKLFKCSSCPYEAAHRSKLLTHERTHTCEKPFKCSSCPYEAAQKSHLVRHERTHTGDKSFNCSSCPYQAAQKSHLVRHERTHTGEKPFKCSTCPYEAADSSTLREHESTHTGEKPFKCSSCRYEAVKMSTLRRHERIHTGEKPFKCISCPYEASDRSTLRKHERTHTGEKPFKCSSCPYKAAQKYSLRVHERTHTGEKPFKYSS